MSTTSILKKSKSLSGQKWGGSQLIESVPVNSRWHGTSTMWFIGSKCKMGLKTPVFLVTMSILTKTISICCEWEWVRQSDQGPGSQRVTPYPLDRIDLFPWCPRTEEEHDRIGFGVNNPVSMFVHPLRLCEVMMLRITKLWAFPVHMTASMGVCWHIENHAINLAIGATQKNQPVLLWRNVQHCISFSNTQHSWIPSCCSQLHTWLEYFSKYSSTYLFCTTSCSLSNQPSAEFELMQGPLLGGCTGTTCL